MRRITVGMFINGLIVKCARPRRCIVTMGVFSLALGALLWTFFFTTNAYGAQEGAYKKYVDPNGRFSFDYPASMRCTQRTADDVSFSHPSASLRIAVLVEARNKEKSPDPQALVESNKKSLSEGAEDAGVLEEGRLPDMPGPQGYLVCSFKDKNGRKVMQLVQYYVARDKIFQMIISDRPQGFLNVEKVIRHIHRSLKIMKPSLD